MKIKQKNVFKPLIKFYLLKNQYYTQFDNLNNLVLNFKSCLKIIYLYEKKKKKILFVGFNYNKFIYNQVNQCFISKQRFLKKPIDYTKFDLIVFNKTSSQDFKVIKTLNTLDIPIIIFEDYSTKGYRFNGLSTKKSFKNFNFFMLFSVLIKHKKIKNDWC